VPFAAALVGAGVLVGAAYGLLRVTLPRTSSGEKLALKTLTRLETWRSYGAVVSFGSRTLDATCSGQGLKTVLTYENGARVLVRGRNVHPLAPIGPESTRLLADRALQPRVEPDLLVAEAVLGGTRTLYMTGLAVALAKGRDPFLGTTRFDGIRTNVFLLEEHPRVELLVSARTFMPLAVRYRSAHLRGSSLLVTDRSAARLAAAGSAGC
jgi:hypothetical protein